MNLLQDMVRDVVDRGVDYDDALCALRHFARYYGGQHIYIPVHADTALAEQIRRIFTERIFSFVMIPTFLIFPNRIPSISCSLWERKRIMI